MHFLKYFLLCFYFYVLKFLHLSFAEIIENRAENLCDGKISGVICGGDCETIMICLPGLIAPYFQANCSTLSDKTPFCVQNECKTKPDTTNPNCVRDEAPTLKKPFKCTSFGVFPDPYDCQQFHLCEGVNATPKTNRCPDKMTYISSLKTCMITTECQTFNCGTPPTTAIGMNVYSYDNAFYGLCMNYPNGTSEIIMFKCPDEINYIYDLSMDTCKYNCKEIGNFVDRFDCHSYVSCYPENGILKGVQVKCPIGYYFNEKISQCDIDLQNCSSEIITEPITTTTSVTPPWYPPTPESTSTTTTSSSSSSPTTTTTATPTTTTAATPTTTTTAATTTEIKTTTKFVIPTPPTKTPKPQ